MIRVENISFWYGEKSVLTGVRFGVNPGEIVAIIGPNGAGKSTLLKLLDGILLPREGEIFIAGESLVGKSRKSLARQIGFVPQHFSTAFDYTVREIVAMGRFPFSSMFSEPDREGSRAVREAMEATDVWPFRDRSLDTLSGGEKQRVVLASALAQEPQILLLDEPTAALDIRHQAHFLEILTSLSRSRRLTILLVTHDVNLASQFCDRIIVLKDGQICGDGPPDKIVRLDLMEEIYQTPVQVLKHPGDGKPVLFLRRMQKNEIDSQLKN